MQNQPPTTMRSSEELDAELSQLREQQSVLRKALHRSTAGESNESYIGKSYRWVTHDQKPELTVTGIRGTGALADIILTSRDDQYRRELPVATFRAELESSALQLAEASEVGASLIEHAASQVPQAWAPELVRNDVPAYVAPEDRNAWLPVAEGSWWLWPSREDKAIVQVVEVEGPAPEARVTIKVPFSAAHQHWKASDFGPGQRFEPLPEYKGLFFVGADRTVFLVEDIKGDQVLAHDAGAAEAEWDDFSTMLRALDKGFARPATLEEAEAWKASFEQDASEEAIADDPPTLQPAASVDRFTQAREWLDMVHGYPSLEARNAHGIELVGAIATELGVEYSTPEGLAGAKLADSIAEALRFLMMPTKAQDPGRDPVLDATPDEIREAEAKALARITPEACTIEPEQPKPPRSKRGKGGTTPSSDAAAPRMTLDDLERCIKLNHEAIANLQADNEKLQAKAVELANQERRELEERQKALEKRLRSMGISA